MAFISEVYTVTEGRFEPSARELLFAKSGLASRGASPLSNKEVAFVARAETTDAEKRREPMLVVNLIEELESHLPVMARE